MRRVDQLFLEYEAFHKDPRNKLCHYLGITLIVFTIVSLLEQVRLLETPAGPLDLALPVVVGVVGFYLFLDVALGVGALFLLAAALVGGRYVPWPVSVGVFLFGWVLQFVGHAFEGKRPAFLRNGVHLLVGPLWILSHLYEKVGLRAKSAPA